MWSIFPYESNFVDIIREEINGIPCLKFKPKGYQGKLPTIIDYHGWHSSKDFKRFEALITAGFGYQVIVPDALYHGDRDPVDHDNPENLEKYVWTIILQSVKESEKLIESIVRDHDADMERIAVMGTSMGAITAGGVFALNTEIKCLVGLNGTFAWQEAIERGHLPKAGKENEEAVKCNDPMNNEESFKERAVLILHGTEDTSVPIETQKLFFNKMAVLYTDHPEKLQLLEESNVDHRVTTGMMERAIMWLKENL